MPFLHRKETYFRRSQALSRTRTAAVSPHGNMPGPPVCALAGFVDPQNITARARSTCLSACRRSQVVHVPSKLSKFSIRNAHRKCSQKMVPKSPTGIGYFCTSLKTPQKSRGLGRRFALCGAQKRQTPPMATTTKTTQIDQTGCWLDRSHRRYVWRCMHAEL